MNAPISNDQHLYFSMVQATNDLEDIDKERRGEFKTYEMEKEHLRREKLHAMDERHKREEEERYRELQKKHKDHPKLHHPVSRVDLMSVIAWIL